MMSGNGKPGFFYLNRDNRWPDFHLNNVEINRNGELQLRAVPRALNEAPKAELKFEPPAGIAAAADGTIFLSAPSTHRLWRIDPCDAKGEPQIMSCFGGEGYSPSRFREPRGLFVHEKRRALLIADTFNHRIQFMNLDSLQVAEIWKARGNVGEPQPGALNEPIAMAGDTPGNIYVLSRHGMRLQKFDFFGQVEAAFWTAVESSGQLTNPVALSIASVEGVERVFVLDRGLYPTGGGRVLQFDTSGEFVSAVTLQNAQATVALVATSTALFIGDHGREAIIKYDLNGTEIGAAVGFAGAATALAADSKGNLLAHTGDAKHPVRLAMETGYLTTGEFWSGPLAAGPYETMWHRLTAWAKPLPAEAHVQFYATTEKPEPGEKDADLPKPDDPPEIIRAKLFLPRHERPFDVMDLLMREPQALYLFVGARLSGDGTGSPRLSQIRVNYDQETLVRRLPAIYQDDKAAAPFLAPALALFESFFEEAENKIRDLPALFDPYAVPQEFLSWLAGWLGLDIDANWSEALTRRAIAEAFANYAWRGTAKGLRRSLETYAGVTAHLVEPILDFNLWSLGETSTLGLDTMLVAAHPQGAVVGTTATLDQSHLITNHEMGAPLFEEIAHQFSVMVYPNAVNSPQQLAEIKTIIERDKPAHTAYHLCVVQPSMRVGFQAMVGVDTVIGGPLAATPLSAGGLVLSGTPLAKLGEDSQVGINTQLF